MDYSKHLTQLFARRKVADMQALRRAAPGRSRRSLFRDLATLGYLSSYTHTGRYYTLSAIAEFDDDGLWRYQGIGFSYFGTLKADITHRVEEAESGCTHTELEAVLRLRVHNTLLRLVRAGEIGREVLRDIYVYVSADEERGSRQLDARRQQAVQAEEPATLPVDELVLLVLVETLHASEGLAAPAVVAARLTARGEAVVAEQVERVFEQFRLEPGKKTAAPR